MPRERLIELLDEVHQELETEGGTDLDPDVIARLREVDEDIRGWLDKEEDERPAEFFREQFVLFRAKYPTLTEVLDRVADQLGKMGI